MEQLWQPQFWVAVVQIIWIDIVLSGDNAVVIAMACRDLRPRERRWGMIIGASAAAALLVIFTLCVSALIQLPGLRIVAAGALLLIAVRLLGPKSNQSAGTLPPAESLWRAVRLIVVADVVMSLDNAVAVAAVANGRYGLLALGLAISIPTVVAGSAIVLALIERLPIIIWIGGAILGWVAGELLVSDPLLAPRMMALMKPIFGADSHAVSGLDAPHIVFGLLGAVIVIIAGRSWRRMRAD
jgi:YjbE family integral membrane protein